MHILPDKSHYDELSVCAYIDRIMSGGWGFPISAAAAFMRALRFRLSE
jgi:hypothetical protein